MLRTERVYLRKLEQTDLGRCHTWINTSEILDGIGLFGPRSLVEQEHWYQSIQMSRTNIVFAVCLVADDSHIGNASVFDIDYRNRNAGLAVFIGDAINRNRGSGTDVVKLLADYAFDYLNLHRVYVKTSSEVAAMMYKRIGFIQEGVMREHAFFDGAYVDKRLFGLLRDDRP